MSLSNLMEEETIGSFIVRNMLSSGNVDIKKICSPLFNTRSNEWNVFPCANENFLSQSKILFSKKSFKDIAKNHTLIPLFRLTGSHRIADIYEKYLMTYMGPERTKTFRQDTVSIGEPLTSAIKYCTLCFEEQIHSNGFSWFKREWQIAEMNHCLKHKSKLSHPRCNICGNNTAAIRLIKSALYGECCYCSNKLP